MKNNRDTLENYAIVNYIGMLWNLLYHLGDRTTIKIYFFLNMAE